MKTMMDAATLTITRIPVPATLDAADAGPFLETARIADEVCRYYAGHDYFDQDAAEQLPSWQDQTDRLQLGYTAERDGEIVGALTMMIPLEDGANNVEFDVMVPPAHLDRGIEQALFAVLETEARAHGRSVVQTWTLHKPDLSGPQLASPTGLGSIPADDPQTKLMLAQGYSFEQTERNSVFDLTGSFERVEAMLAEARRAAGADYRLVTWTSPTPDEYKDGFAHVISRMSTDVPTGELVWVEEAWDAARVERRDKRLLAGGHTVSVTAVQHVPSGEIVAYNELVIAADHTAPTHQWGTLVLKEHRGHRLGALVKCANLVRWRDLMPDSPRVSTFNAEENRPMLDINEAIGFVPASYAGAWKKTLDA
ncbi:GNAT family N-acetyltransferase [Microbacterium aoyamense]|uniref:GNAT family N-acetyltransferase n=1 Tax=Microbacterium aoyamense TaxID=344166 RepID=A0ABN2P9V5_9MICO|nr:GNAT family N-acetyltransferase [Microbacterium aoyamense]